MNSETIVHLETFLLTWKQNLKNHYLLSWKHEYQLEDHQSNQ